MQLPVGRKGSRAVGAIACREAASRGLERHGVGRECWVEGCRVADEGLEHCVGEVADEGSGLGGGREKLLAQRVDAGRGL